MVIIALLACLMLTVVSEVRAAATSASCASNLRQLGVALEMYRALWGCFPAHERRVRGERRRRRQQLDSVSKLGRDVMSCPAADGWVVGRNNSYGYNYRYLGSTRRLTDGSAERSPIRILERSAHTIAFGDSAGTDTLEPYEPVPYTQAELDLPHAERRTRIGSQGFLRDPTHLPQRTRPPRGEPEPRARTSRSRPKPLHSPPRGSPATQAGPMATFYDATEARARTNDARDRFNVRVLL
ncbi:MAG: DUF1559 domain-containing protein [Planctomycetota bacterium]